MSTDAPNQVCPTCGAGMAAGQDWCLECGSAAPGRLGARPGWRAVGTITGLTAVLVAGAAAAGYAAITDPAPDRADRHPGRAGPGDHAHRPGHARAGRSVGDDPHDPGHHDPRRHRHRADDPDAVAGRPTSRRRRRPRRPPRRRRRRPPRRRRRRRPRRRRRRRPRRRRRRPPRRRRRPRSTSTRTRSPRTTRTAGRAPRWARPRWAVDGKDDTMWDVTSPPTASRSASACSSTWGRRRRSARSS